jgi:hypothetical protein
MLLNFNGRSLDVNSVFEKDIKPNLMSIIEKGNKDNCFLYNRDTLWFGQRIPSGFEFNKVYYKVNGKTLQGFKIRMCMLNKNADYKIYYLVEYPNGRLEWKEDFLNGNTLLFESPNDFFDYLNGNSEVAVRIKVEMLSFFSNRSPLDYIRFSKTWYWSNKDEKPMIKYSNIKYILFNELGLIPILRVFSGEYHSQEECMKEKMNGFTIEEFSQTDSFNVDIEIKKKEPIIRTLKFIEQ